jgi:hypothetical protein
MLTYHPEATIEVRDARRWYEDQRSGLGDEFLQQVMQAEDFVESRPLSCSQYLYGTRRYRLRRFPFDVVITVVGSEVKVIAVAHTSRKPGYWRHRL